MEAALEPAVILVLGGVALLAGFVDAVAGGGGMLVMPALLSTGMLPHLAIGTNKLIGTFGTFSASLTFIRKGLFQPALWWAMSFGTFVGALLVAVLILSLIHICPPPRWRGFRGYPSHRTPNILLRRYERFTHAGNFGARP